MAITKRVVLSQIEVVPNGTLQVRLDKQVVDGETVLAREFHRTVVPPGTDVDAQMALVTAHLKQMGWPAPEGIERIRRIAAVEHTSGAKAAYKKALKAAEEAAAAS